MFSIALFSFILLCCFIVLFFMESDLQNLSLKEKEEAELVINVENVLEDDINYDLLFCCWKSFVEQFTGFAAKGILYYLCGGCEYQT